MNVTELLTNWNSFFSNHTSVKVIIFFAHIGGLLFGGGAAMAADRAILRRGSDPAARSMLLDEIASTHRIVLTSIAFIVVSGLLLAAADFDNFIHSRLFWLKIALVVTLLTNGAVLERASRMPAPSWPALRRTALASLTLWPLTALVGVALSNSG